MLGKYNMNNQSTHELATIQSIERDLLNTLMKNNINNELSSFYTKLLGNAFLQKQN